MTVHWAAEDGGDVRPYTDAELDELITQFGLPVEDRTTLWSSVTVKRLVRTVLLRRPCRTTVKHPPGQPILEGLE